MSVIHLKSRRTGQDLREITLPIRLENFRPPAMMDHSERCEIAVDEVLHISEAICRFIAANPRFKRSRTLAAALRQCDATMGLLENGE